MPRFQENRLFLNHLYPLCSSICEKSLIPYGPQELAPLVSPQVGTSRHFLGVSAWLLFETSIHSTEGHVRASGPPEDCLLCQAPSTSARQLLHLLRGARPAGVHPRRPVIVTTPCRPHCLAAFLPALQENVQSFK